MERMTRDGYEQLDVPRFVPVSHLGWTSQADGGGAPAARRQRWRTMFATRLQYVALATLLPC